MAYLPLSTANLPDPVIDPAQGASPEDYFGIDTYSGTSATHERSALQFQPDFVWIKERNNTGLYHCLFDSIRGATNILYSNDTSAEATNANTLTSFDSDGFTLGNDSNNYGVNRSVGTYVAWNWKANGSGVSNNVGSIPSTVSANTTSGFSIVTYTGVSGGGTVGHGLGVKPSCIIVKNRSQADNWWIWHQGMESSGENGEDYLFFTTAASADDNYQYLANNSTTFTPQGTSKLMQDGGNFVAYCWAEVEGYSKFGSYVGNGSTDGPFVYTGFRPSFCMWKRTDVAGGMWMMFDVKRTTYNVMDSYLQAQASNAEASYPFVDFLSNGFKHRHNSQHNNISGGTYIYMAFAENPFKYSNAR